MRHYLVVANQALLGGVANQALLGGPLLDRIKGCLAAGPCRFYLIVPAAQVPDRSVWTESHDRPGAPPARALHLLLSIGPFGQRGGLRTWASQEVRPLLLPLALATLAANWSLLRKRSHYPSDIVTGWVLGSAVAFAAWKLGPNMESPDETGTADDDRADIGQPAPAATRCSAHGPC